MINELKRTYGEVELELGQRPDRHFVEALLDTQPNRLDQEFRTLRYELRFEARDRDTIHYHEDTVLQIKGLPEPFHHTDENTLRRVE